MGRIVRAKNVFGALLYAKLFGKRLPVRVALQITKYCNMNCTYCYANFDTYKNVKEKTTEEIFQWIDELYAHGTRGLWFLGGEPMMRKDFGEIIEHATRKGIFCDMNSNGVLINEKNIDVVKKLDAVAISLDGDEGSNDFYRGKGSYQKAVEAIKLLRKNNVPVRLHCILTKRTWKKLDHMANLSKELGATLGYCEVLLHNPDSDDHILSDQESKEFYTQYLRYKKRGYPIVHSRLAIEHMLRWPKKEGIRIYKEEMSKYPKNSFVPCLSGDIECFYDLDGRLYACPGTWEDGLNCNEVGFKKAWDYLANRRCIACKCIGATQLHMAFSLSPRSMFHAIKNVIALRS
jgi:MoaA/NifB/PqqE/SkfB family radical SAM enzyme